MTTTRKDESTVGLLFLAVELGSTQWKLAFAVVHEVRPRMRTIAARDLAALDREIVRARERWHLAPATPVRSCYEAGRDGFWLHRALEARGIGNVVVDPASIAVDRRQRRAKTDRLDATALVRQLMNAAAGDRRGWREVRVPSVRAEAERHLAREWNTVIEDRKRIRNRLQGLLVTQGLTIPLTSGFLTAVATAQTWDGAWLPAALVARLTREWQHLRQVEARVAALRRARRAWVQSGPDHAAAQVRQLTQLRGVGETGALPLVTELYAWRGFTNGRQIGAVVGLTPTPYHSDQTVIEQGISRSGNRRIRALSIELAWSWLRYQPTSALSRWFLTRFGGHRRARRIGIVALARKLLIAWWRYLNTGQLPEGAQLKRVMIGDAR